MDASTQRTLNRGAKLTELLKQSQYAPLEVGIQVATIYAGTRGYLDKVELADVKRYEAGLISHLRTNHQELLNKIEARAKLPAVEDELKQAITAYDEGFK